MSCGPVMVAILVRPCAIRCSMADLTPPMWSTSMHGADECGSDPLHTTGTPRLSMSSGSGSASCSEANMTPSTCPPIA